MRLKFKLIISASCKLKQQLCLFILGNFGSVPVNWDETEKRGWPNHKRG